jgi:hypothetical protein
MEGAGVRISGIVFCTTIYGHAVAAQWSGNRFDSSDGAAVDEVVTLVAMGNMENRKRTIAITRTIMLFDIERIT